MISKVYSNLFSAVARPGSRKGGAGFLQTPLISSSQKPAFRAYASANRPTEVKASRWTKPLIGLVGFSGLSFGIYEYFSGGTQPQGLGPHHWSKYNLVRRDELGPDLLVIELEPQVKPSKPTTHWDGHKLWSVEVKQPDIQVVRRYTPLPIFTDESDGKQKVYGEEDVKGNLTFIVKRYNDGEVSRWLHRRKLGSLVELRGPYTEYEFPTDINTENVPPAAGKSLFLGAGTGIAPILQSLLSVNSPTEPVDVIYSIRKKGDIPFVHWMKHLEDQGKASFNVKVDADNSFVGITDIPSPSTTRDTASSLPSRAIVCGPDGYIRYVAGRRVELSQGPIGGLLAAKGWTSSNVYKM